MNAKDLLDKLYGVATVEVDDPLTTIVSASTPTRLLPNDPGALQVTIINTGGTDMHIWTDSSVSNSKGILIAASGGSYEIDITRFALMPTREWWALGNGGATTASSKRTTIL